MANVSVKPDVLQWALDRSNKSVESLRAQFPKLQQWLKGDATPTLSQLELFAQATAMPLGWLFLDEPIHEEIPIPYFRTITDQPVQGASADLLETVYAIERRQDWMREFLTDHEGQSPLAFVGSMSHDAPAVEIAERMGWLLNLVPGWSTHCKNSDEALRILRDAMEAAGIFVVTNSIVGNNTYRALKPEEFRGFVLVDEYAPFVFVNGADVKAGQMFTLAHELAHVLLGRSAVFDLRELMPSIDPVERACNQAAAEFLVPEAQLRLDWPSVAGLKSPFNVLSSRYKVSRIVVARRALDINLISRSDFSSFYRMYVGTQQKKERHGGGDFYANQPNRIGTRFGRAVVRAVREGILPYTEAYSLTGLTGKTFDKFAEQVA